MPEEVKPSVSTPAPTPPIVTSKAADPNANPKTDAVNDNMAQGSDTKKHDALHLVSPAVADPVSIPSPATDITSGDILKKIKVILAEHDGKESDIPLSNIYWNYLNQYRRLVNQERDNA